MLKGQDIVVLIGCAVRENEPGWAEGDVRSLARTIGFDSAGTNRSMRRLLDVQLLVHDERTVNRTAAAEFVVHGLRYVFPARRGEPTRGLPTLWGAAPLSDAVASVEPAPVWPDAHGTSRGPALHPIHPIAISAAHSHPDLYRALVAIDGIRAGSARERALAGSYLERWLGVRR